MQNIDNSMDELFRKAADDYMPGIGNSEWKAIQARLSEAADMEAVPVAKKKKSIFRIWFVLPSVVAALLLIFDGDHFQNGDNKEVMIPVQKENQQRNKYSIEIGEEGVAPVLKYNNKQLPATEKKTAGKNINLTIVPHHRGETVPEPEVPVAEEKTAEKRDDDRPGTSSYITQLPQDHAMERTNGAKDLKTKPETSANPSPVHLPEANGNTLTDKKSNLEKEAAIPVPAAAGMTSKSAKMPDSASAATASSSKQSVAARQAKLYIGVVAGPEISQVQRQGFTRAGIHAGLLAGYRLSKQTAIESGAEFKKKYYYSDGKYFRMKATPGAPAMTVLNLDGSSNVLEVPVRLNYLAWQREATSLFVLGGISSDLLIRERNNYHLSVNGVPQTMLSHYRKVSLHMASTADISIGYEHALGRDACIRLQPYVQIPLQGMGVGNMQVMSAGVNIAVIKPFR